jgi:C1A family cysteine protease
MSRTIQRYGWRPDLPDHRDFKFALTMKTATPVPRKADLRALMPPIQDQGQLGSCTAHATVAMLEHNTIEIGQPLVPLSRLFTYYNARAVESATASDSGAMLRDVISSLAADGVCPETDWPYDITQFAVKPSDTAYTDATTAKISVYARLNDQDDMLVCLASGHPFVFGFTVYDYFETDEMATTGVLKLPEANESVLGGHAVCAVGYDLDLGVLIVRNSYGPTWGQAGHFTMPLAYATNTNLADDFWTVRV